MVTVKFSVYSKNKGIIESPTILPILREKLSVANKQAHFIKKSIGRDVPRIYCITLGGKFDLGLYSLIIKTLKTLPIQIKFEYSPDFRQKICPTIEGFEDDLPPMSLPPYEYQDESVRRMMKFGRGCILVGTGGGKTFIMALLTKTVRQKKPDTRILVIVPTLQLVEQTYTDFIDYGYDPSDVSKWSGSNAFTDSPIIIVNVSILQSKLSDLSFLSKIDLLMVDEVHVLKKSNDINKIIDKIPAVNRFGFTGTLPEDIIDQWNMFGKIGPVIYEKSSDSLRKDNYISQCKIDVIKVHYNTESTVEMHRQLELRKEKYVAEMEFLINHDYRNRLICRTAIVSRGNSLIMVDRIQHGLNIQDILNKDCSHKQIFFIQGSVDVEDREVIRGIMETNHDVICIAVSKIFSTGINIKNIHNIIFATPGKAKVKLIQSIGRGLRLHKLKSILKVFDFTDDLHYSNRHLELRVKLYAAEKLKYDIRNIREPRRKSSEEKS